jgi:hypothetical protein
MLRRKTPLKAKTGFKKRGGKLNPVSERLKQRSIEYSRVRKEYLEEKDWKCEICNREATDIHHKKGRGKNTCNKQTFMATCRLCHQYIHDNPAWARENNYLIYEYK